MMAMRETSGVLHPSIHAPPAAGLGLIKPLKRVTRDSKGLLRRTQILEQLALSSALEGFRHHRVSV